MAVVEVTEEDADDRTKWRWEIDNIPHGPLMQEIERRRRQS